MSVSGKLTAIADQIRAHYGISGGMSIADMIRVMNAGKSLIERIATSITIPNGVTSIGNYAFMGYKALASITIPNSVTSIGRLAFAECRALASITIPDSVTSIGSLAFSACTALTSITIPSSVTSIESGAFSNCHNLTDIYCGFAEGAVPGAPWEAPDTTTIHYNTTT